MILDPLRLWSRNLSVSSPELYENSVTISKLVLECPQFLEIEVILLNAVCSLLHFYNEQVVISAPAMDDNIGEHSPCVRIGHPYVTSSPLSNLIQVLEALRFVVVPVVFAIYVPALEGFLEIER